MLKNQKPSRLCPPAGDTLTQAQPTREALRLTNFCDPKTDPSGSYTGRPVQRDEKPVQDADDL